MLRELHYKGLLMHQKGYYAKYKEAFFGNNYYDVVFLGSSRVAMHFNTQVFDSITGCNSFNLSLSGANAPLAYAALKTYLEKHKAPEYLFYETDIHFVKFNTHDIKEFNNYFPFLKNKTLLEEFNRIDGRMYHFYYNPFYSWPYTGLQNISSSLHGWFGKEERYDNLFYKGYIKDNFHPQLVETDTIKPYFNYFEPGNRAYLDSIINLCKQKSIQIYLVTSPMFKGGNKDVSNMEGIFRQVNNIALYHNIEHWNYSTTPYCSNEKLFVDHFHMNYLGANLFSIEFAQKFSNKFQKKAF